MLGFHPRLLRLWPFKTYAALVVIVPTGLSLAGTYCLGVAFGVTSFIAITAYRANNPVQPPPPVVVTEKKADRLYPPHWSDAVILRTNWKNDRFR